MALTQRHPIADGDSAPFWEAAKAHRLALQECTRCHALVYYPRALCPHCHGTRLDWRGLSGRGQIYSFTVSRRAATPEFESRVPYVVALIQLEEGVRMLAGIATSDVESVRCDQRVQVCFEDIGDGVVLPMFEVVGPETAEVQPVLTGGEAE